jgi:simple sugar transport system ATP-binding protein
LNEGRPAHPQPEAPSCHAASYQENWSRQDGIYEIVRRLAEAGVAIIMISDEIPEVFYHSHRVVIMRNGRFVGEFLPRQSSEDALRDAVNA